MTCKTLTQDDDAVSPVIGVILMVAITVILAAVGGAYIVTFGKEEQEVTPQANFEFEYDSGTTGSNPVYSGGAGGDLTIRHNGGDTVDGERLAIRDDDGNSISSPFASDVTTGTSITIAVDDDDVIRIVYTPESDSASTSVTLAEFDASQQ